jgi:UPF0716 family protein affecting phage T7 exclusion
LRCNAYADCEGFSGARQPIAAAWWSAMILDVNTLLLVTTYVEAILGLLLLFAWVQNTSITAMAWWGFAHCCAPAW